MATISVHKIPSNNWTYPKLSQNSVLKNRKSNHQNQEAYLKQGTDAPIPDGPKKLLWSSPSDQLLGKLVLKPPVIRRYQQVNTFHNITKIGEELEKEMIKQFKDELKQKLDELRENLNRKHEIEMLKMREKLKKSMHVMYILQLRDVYSKLLKEFKRSITKREQDLIVKGEKSKKKAVDTMKKRIEQEMRNAIDTIETNYRGQLNFLTNLNNNEIRQTYLQKLNINDKRWKKYITSLHQKNNVEHQKQKLQIKQLQNLFNEEKNKPNEQLRKAVKYFTKKIDCLNGQIGQLYGSLCKISEKFSKTREMENLSWKCLLKDVLNEFQVFIDFVLKAVPGDAEFLLSLEKLLERKNISFRQRLEDVESAVKEVNQQESIDEKRTLVPEKMNAIITSIIDKIGDATATELPKNTHALEEFVQEIVDRRASIIGNEVEFEKTPSPLGSSMSPTISLVPDPLANVSTDNSLPWKEEIRKQTQEDSRQKMVSIIDLSSTTALTKIKDSTNVQKDMKPEALMSKFDFDREPSVCRSEPFDLNQGQVTYLTGNGPTRPLSDKKVAEDSNTKIGEHITEQLSEGFTASEEMDLKFVGIDRPPPPRQKDQLCRTSLVALLNILKAHPRLHNLIVEQ